jgi:outer membrane protein assembly factor BamB
VGHASPIVVGDRVILSTADEKTQTRSLICHERKTGTVLWTTPIHGGAFLAKHQKNSHASPTPACDGLQVYVPYAAGESLWLAALDLDGHIVWQPQLGPFQSEHGYASSPVLYKDLVIVAADQPAAGPGLQAENCLFGVDRRTGEVVWRARPPMGPSYASPVVAHVAGRDQLLLSGPERITSYDPATGKEIWFCRWSAQRSANSVACSTDCVYASATWRTAEVVCVRANGSGDVTDSHRVWRQKQGASDVPSPLFHQGRLYLVSDWGLATCLDGATGQPVWQQRLGGAFTASPVLAGEHIFATDEDGITHVFEAGPSFEAVAKNRLNDPVLASPALSGDRLFLRSARFLWCLDGTSNKPESPVPTRAKPSTPPAKANAADNRRPMSPAEKDGEDPWEWWLVAAGAIALGIVLGSLVVLLVALFRRRPDEQNEPGAAPVKKTPVPAVASPSLSFACSACGKKLKVKVQLAGKEVSCPVCHATVPVSGLRRSVRGAAAD